MNSAQIRNDNKAQSGNLKNISYIQYPGPRLVMRLSYFGEKGIIKSFIIDNAFLKSICYNSISRNISQ